MTPMSRLHPRWARLRASNPAKRLAQRPMARPLLPLIAALLLSGAIVGGSACVIPPDLQPAEADAGPSSPPVVVSVQPSPDFAQPGPIVLARPDNRVLVLDVHDNDIGDSTFVRFYVDYNVPPLNVPLPPLADCQTPSTDQVERLVSCSVNALCNSIEPTDTGNHVLQAMVADRPFIADSDPRAEGQPAYRAVEDPLRAAYSFATWTMQCQPPPGS